MALQTNFPAHVQESIGKGFVLVAKKAAEFDFCEPDNLEGVTAHLEWFHNFWWVNDANTQVKLVAFYDYKAEAVHAGQENFKGWNGDLYNWAVYNSAGVIQDGKY